MCVAAFAWNAHPDWLLVAIGNRDEFHARPSAPLARWDDGSGIIAGRDLAGGGTWLGVSEAGRFSLVTNFRVPAGPQPGRPTRGALVTDMLTGREPADVAAMNPFNLVSCDVRSARFLCNYPQPENRVLDAGVHGLSNGGFDMPWAKTLALQDAVTAWCASGTAAPAPLFAALRDERPPRHPRSSSTGPESRYAPVFIRDPAYGTRCSTIVMVERSGKGRIIEKSFAAEGEETKTVEIEFCWPRAMRLACSI